MNPTEEFLMELESLVHQYEKKTGVIVHGISLERSETTGLGSGIRGQWMVTGFKLNIN